MKSLNVLETIGIAGCRGERYILNWYRGIGFRREPVCMRG